LVVFKKLRTGEEKSRNGTKPFWGQKKRRKKIKIKGTHEKKADLQVKGKVNTLPKG